MAMDHPDASRRESYGGERSYRLLVAHSKSSCFATRTARSRPRGLRRGAPFQKDSQGIHETLFKRIGSVFPPSSNPVAGNKCEHPFHHFREMQGLPIGANFAALLAFGEESFVLLVELKRFLAQNARRIGHQPRLLCNETMELGIFVPRRRPLADHATNAVGYAAIVAFELAFHRRD